MYRDLAVWLAGLGCYAPALLRPALFPGVGRGLQARHSFQPGSILLSIPRDALVTPSLAAAALPDLSDLPGPALLAAWLLLERRRGALSSHAPYIASLPRHYTTPYFCLSAELEVMPAWLRGPVELQREAVAAERAAAAARGARTSLQEWAWAWASVNTRAVYLPDQGLALAPFLDLLNHSGDVAVETGLDLVAGELPGYQLVTKTGVTRHRQAFINYGPHDNTVLVLEYGFLLPDNPQHCYRLQLPDLVLFLTSSLTSPALLDTKLDIIRTAKLDTRLSVTGEGLSWSAKTGLRILTMSSSQLQTWHTVFQDSEDCDKDPALLRLYSEFVLYLIRNLRETLSAMTRLASDCSESFVVCLDLVRSYACLLEQAAAAHSQKSEV